MITLLGAAVLVFSTGHPGRLKRESQTSNNLEQRIHRVESSLVPLDPATGETPTPKSLMERMHHYKVPGVSVAVIDNKTIAWARGYGIADVATGQSVDVDTRFQAASISKPVSAMAALHLVQEGKLDLDEDVNRRLVSWKVPENEYTQTEKVTLRRILSHSAGLTVHAVAGFAVGERVPSLVDILDGKKGTYSEPVVVDYVPGSKMRYSGGGFCVLQQLLVDVTGKSFPALMQETVLGKLGMSDSTFDQPLPASQSVYAATGYDAQGAPVPGRWRVYPEMAPAGLWTTPSDLAIFVIELLRSREGKANRVLSSSMTRQMLTPQIEGMGLGIFTNRSASPFSHGGGNDGFRCLLAAFADSGKGVVIMTNSDNATYLIAEIVHSVAAEYGFPPE